MTNANGSVILCIENPMYGRYLEEEFANTNATVTAVTKEDLAQAIVEHPAGGVLLLQSDAAEHSLIELSSKLKRLFGDDIHTLLLSSDYLTADEAGTSVDGFLHYPAPFEQVQETIKGLSSTARRILIIDDSKLVHSHLASPLKEAGYEVFDAFDGEAGLARAKALKPDLIICDIEMPRMNGFDVCAAIRQTAGIANTYIIMSSTLGSAADQQKGFESGVDEYITKPVIIPELIDRIEKVFKAAGTRENILILEDDDQVARNIAKSLSTQGFATRTTETIKTALRILKRMNYDLIISEIHLADGSMIDLCNALKTLPQDRQPDVLTLTSRDRQADEKMVMNAGAAGIVSKPFTMDSILASVERALADRRANQEKAQLEKYVSKASKRMALEKSILSGKMATTRAYKKQGTIFFSDIADFTGRCETYPPAEVVTQVNTLFEVMTRIIMAHDGDIDKFIGDACMAFWLDDDLVFTAERAIRATLHMRKAIDLMNQESPVLAADPIHIRMGLNTGDVILCDLGAADARIDLTMIGDTVNTAARFESAAKQYGIYNLFSEYTIEPLLGTFAARLIDRVKVKGKNQPVACYEVLGEKGTTTPQEDQLITEFSRALASYQSGDFEQALIIFQAADGLEKVTENGALNPCRLYQHRCRYLLDHPPQDWDGVWTLTAK